MRPIATPGATWRRSVRPSTASRVAASMGVLALMVGLGVAFAPVPRATASTSITQLGLDIDGGAAEDQSGYSVALSADGSRVAIGAIFNEGSSGAFSEAGHVRVYDWSGTAWVQLGGDIDGEAAYDQSGWSVSLSADGSRLAIGAHRNDGSSGPSTEDAGHVRVYEWSGTAWVQVGGDIDGEAAYDESGHSVSLSADGSRVAIGARLNDGSSGPNSDAGHVRVFEWSGTAWVQVGGDIDGEADSDRSGESVSLSAGGSRVAIGAISNDGAGSSAGHVRVYDWDGTAWVQVGGDIDGEAAGDQSGYSVALTPDGSRLAIGAITNDGSAVDAGHVRVYDWTGTAWVQVGSDIDGEAAGDQSGFSVSMCVDGSRVAIGAVNNDGTGGAVDLAGHVRVYDWDGAAWLQVGGDIDGEAAVDQSGWNVPLSADGSRVAIGAPYNDGGGTNAGHVRVNTLPGSCTVDDDEKDDDSDRDRDHDGAPVPTSIPSGEGPMPAASPLLPIAAVGLGLLGWRSTGRSARRRAR